ncbi:hypothetical protein WN943_016462 [Citrus x changshan-huyou]
MKHDDLSDFISGFVHSLHLFMISSSLKPSSQVTFVLFSAFLSQVHPGGPSQEPWLRSGKGYEAFESRMSTLKNVQNALLDPDISIIGVYGMGGVGKTTLVKEVARRAKKDMLFDEVVFAEVSETPDIGKIQGELADQLGMKFSQGEIADQRGMKFSQESDVPGRARKLYARLQKENKILVILDNIWEDLDLEKVGVPSGNDWRGCKVLLTARDRHVLGSIGSKTFQIDVLNEEEAWTLFKKMTGDCAEKGELNSVAIDITKECGGLPIAIVTLAKALRNKSCVSAWKDALRQLKRPSPGNFDGVLAKTYSAIELSIKYLRDEELRKIFFQCSLIGYPQEACIQDLLKYEIGLGRLEGIDTVEEARDKVCTSVQELKDACLLLDCENSDWSISNAPSGIRPFLYDVYNHEFFIEDHFLVLNSDADRALPFLSSLFYFGSLNFRVALLKKSWGYTGSDSNHVVNYEYWQIILSRIFKAIKLWIFVTRKPGLAKRCGNG